MPASADLSARPVLLLGDPRLRARSAEVEDFHAVAFREACRCLAATLAAFRAANGFGRAISAPQIGIPIRLVALNLGEGTSFVVNPRVVRASDETFTMWDDCMSFPGLLVRVRRHRSISLEYEDESGARHSWRDVGIAASELLQHEIDHLDGVLAIDRAIDRESIVMREVWEARHAEMRAAVEYEIGEAG